MLLLCCLRGKDSSERSKFQSNPDWEITAGIVRTPGVACGDALQQDCCHHGYTFHAVHAGSTHPAEIASAVVQFSFASQLETWITPDYSTCWHFGTSVLPRFQEGPPDDVTLLGSGSHGRREGTCCVIRKNAWKGLCCDDADAVQNEQLNQRQPVCLGKGFVFFLSSVSLKQFILFFLRFFIIRNLIIAPDLLELKRDRPSCAFSKSKTSQWWAVSLIENTRIIFLS